MKSNKSIHALTFRQTDQTIYRCPLVTIECSG